MKADVPAVTGQAHVQDHVSRHGLCVLHVQTCCADSMSHVKADHILLLLLLLLLSGRIFSGCMHEQHAARQEIWSLGLSYQVAFNASPVGLATAGEWRSSDEGPAGCSGKCAQRPGCSFSSGGLRHRHQVSY